MVLGGTILDAKAVSSFGNFYQKRRKILHERMLDISASIYHLGGNTTNRLLGAFSLGGMYHVGIEICGVEWSFGYCERGSGVFAVAPTECSLGTFNESVLLGTTDLTTDGVIRILHKLRLEWVGPDYHLVNRNCVLFAREFLKKLSPTLRLPEYSTTLVETGLAVGSARDAKRNAGFLSVEEIFG